MTFQDLRYVNRDGDLVACPALALTVYLDETDRGHVQAFYDRALALVQPHLTHYLTDGMSAPAKIAPRALGMLPAWLRKPKESHLYRLRFWGDGITGVSPYSLEITYDDIPFNAARRSNLRTFYEHYDKKGIVPEALGTVLRVTVPVDVDEARPEVWVPWVLGFDILKDGWFVTAESGYSMVSYGEVSDDNFMRAACSRYPGLDWFTDYQRMFLCRYESSLDTALFQVKRAAWLTFLHETAVKVLGGAEAIGAKLADDPAIRLHPLAHGLCLQAGAAPELGDLSRHQIPEHVRRVAQVIRPVRLKGVPLAFEEQFVDHWFNMYDRDRTEGGRE